MVLMTELVRTVMETKDQVDQASISKMLKMCSVVLFIARSNRLVHLIWSKEKKR